MSTYTPYEFQDKETFHSEPLTTSHGQALEKALVDYYKQEWRAIPCRLEINIKLYGDSKKHVDFGLCDDGTYKKWSHAITHLDPQMDSLRTFRAANAGLPANAIAILTGKESNLFVIDKDSPLDLANKYLADAAVNVYNDIYTVVSGSGGEHYYFRYDSRLDGIPTTTAKFFGKDSPIDFRSNGGLIYAPPSRVYNHDTDSYSSYKIYTDPDSPGKTYRIDYTIPETLVQMILKRHSDKGNNEKVNLATCTKTLSTLTVKQSEWLVKDRQAAIDAPKGTRSEACYKLMCTCLSLKLDKDAIRLKCEGISKFAEKPGYFETVYEAAAKNVDVSKYDYMPKRYSIGTDGKQIVDKPKDVDFTKIEDLAKRLLSRDRVLPKMTWIVPNFLAKDMELAFMGPAGIGKTLCALDLCKSLCTANKIFDCISVDHTSKVLYFQFELNQSVFYEQYIKKLNLDKVANFDYLCKDTLAPEDGVTLTLDATNQAGRLLIEKLICNTNADFVVIDSLKHCFCGDLNKSEVMSELMMWIKGLASRHHKAILVIHHPRKRSMLKNGEIPGDYALDDMAGSGTIGSTVDFAFGINEVYDDTTGKRIEKCGNIRIIKAGSVGETLLKGSKYTIVNTTSSKGEDKVHLKFSFELGVELEPDSVKYKIIAKLFHNPKWSSGALYGAMGINAQISRASYYKALTELSEKGLILRFGKTKNQLLMISESGKEFYNRTNVEIKEEILPMGDEAETEIGKKRRYLFLYHMFTVIETRDGNFTVNPCRWLVPDFEDVYNEQIKVYGLEPDFKADLDAMVDNEYIDVCLSENNEQQLRLMLKGKLAVEQLFPEYFKQVAEV
jgi:hypothetical protein